MPAWLALLCKSRYHLTSKLVWGNTFQEAREWQYIVGSRHWKSRNLALIFTEKSCNSELYCLTVAARLFEVFSSVWYACFYVTSKCSCSASTKWSCLNLHSSFEREKLFTTNQFIHQDVNIKTVAVVPLLELLMHRKT